MDQTLAHLWEEITARPGGPLALRFYLQPLMAMLFATRDGLKDARVGNPPYFWALFTESARRRELIRDGWRSVGKIFLLALGLDVLYQIVVLRGLRPVQGLLIAIGLAIIPYVLLRGPINRMARHRPKLSGRAAMLLLAGWIGLGCTGTKFVPGPEDPLPSWNDGAVKAAIVSFVSRVTTKGGADFVPVGARIATFDNDGTLWPEQPVIEGIFLLERLKTMAGQDSTLREREPYKAALDGDRAYLARAGPESVVDLMTFTHGNETEEQYEADVRHFFTTFRYPKLDLALHQLPYRPMVELLRYLRRNGFQTWLCSGGDADFMRVISDTLYGIPPERVIGTTLQKSFVDRGGRWTIWRKPAILTVNDRAGKPVGIDRQIGQRPLFVAGNVRSGGDIAMMEYSKGRPGPSLQLLINHDDAVREFAYAEKDTASLKAAAAHGFTVVSIRQDWKKVFFQQ